MLGVLIDIRVLNDMLRVKLPAVYRHLRREMVDLATTAVMAWFISIFATVLPDETAARVWDIYFSEGNKVIFRVGVALFKLHATKILSLEGGDLHHFLTNLGHDMHDAELLLDTAFKLGTVRRRTLATWRARHRLELEAQMREMAEFRARIDSGELRRTPTGSFS